MKQDNQQTLTKVQTRFLRMAPRKIRLVADLIRGRSVSEAKNILRFTPKASAPVLAKMLDSGMSNLDSAQADPENVRIVKIMVDGGPTLKRWRPRAMGRATPIRKRTSHITLMLGK